MTSVAHSSNEQPPTVQGKADAAQTQPSNGVSSSNAQGTNTKASKKRTYEEYAKVDEPSIEETLSTLKQRVLNGETLNHFKKEVSLLVELVEKKDPQMDKLADLVGSKLGAILGKPE